jgi:hypothetical protein
MSNPEIIQPELVPAPLPKAYYRSNFWVHIIFTIAAALVILMSVLMRSEGETTVLLPGMYFPLPESCTAKIFLGINCPGCGLTRAFISISSGEFGRAWHFNPASFAVYAFVIVQIPWNAYQAFRIFVGQAPIRSNWLFAAPIVAATCLIMQWLFRMFV